MSDVLTRLAALIAERKGADPESSWTAQLLVKGPEKAAEKFGEEAIEAVIEAVRDGDEKSCETSAEVSDTYLEETVIEDI